MIGWVTSGGYAHYVEESLAQAYVPSALCEREGEGIFEVEILGQRRPAKLALEPLFDPTGSKMRS